MRKVESFVSEKIGTYMCAVTFTTDKAGEYLSVFYRADNKELLTAALCDDWGFRMINRIPKWVKVGFEKWISEK